MFFLSVDAVMEPVQMAEVAQATPKAATVREHTLCGVAMGYMSGKQYSIIPLRDAIDTLPLKDRPKNLNGDAERSALTVILKQPEHGTLDASEYGDYTYRTTFSGENAVEDHFTLQVVYKGKTFILNYRIYIPFAGDASWKWEQNCSEPPFVDWKISLFPPQTTDDLSTLLSTAATAFVGFADLPGSAVAQTTGYYNSGQITLDSNAAGWGWYIDPTPLDNTDDYLPTADPNIWKAKPGSEAEGRMDMIVPPDQGGQPIVLAQATSQVEDVDNTVWTFQDVQDAKNFRPSEYEGENAAQGRIVFPVDSVIGTLGASGWLKEQGISPYDPKNNISVVIETPPKHGRLERIKSGDFAGHFRYTPNEDFVGSDFVSFIVTIEGKRIRVNMDLVVWEGLPLNFPSGDSEEEECVLFMYPCALIKEGGNLSFILGAPVGSVKMGDLPRRQ